MTRAMIEKRIFFDSARSLVKLVGIEGIERDVRGCWAGVLIGIISRMDQCFSTYTFCEAETSESESGSSTCMLPEGWGNCSGSTNRAIEADTMAPRRGRAPSRLRKESCSTALLS